MTGIRTTLVWRFESDFAVSDASRPWQRFGSGADFTFSGNNSLKVNNTIGLKNVDSVQPGRFKGTWSVGNMALDYDIIDYLHVYFDTYAYVEGLDEAGEGTGVYWHTFSKSGFNKVKSFTMKYQKLNARFGGGNDQTGELYGCVCTSCKFNYEGSSNAQIKVSLSGFYADEYMDDTEITQGAWVDMSHTGETVNWACFNVNGAPVKRTERIDIEYTSSGTASLPSCGSRIDSGFSEGTVSAKMNATVYSDSPEWRERLYAGGAKTGLSKPSRRQLTPIPEVTVVSHNSTQDVPFDDKSMTEKMVVFRARNCYLESGGNTFNTRSAIVETIPLVPLGGIELRIANGKDDLGYAE